MGNRSSSENSKTSKVGNKEIDLSLVNKMLDTLLNDLAQIAITTVGGVELVSPCQAYLSRSDVRKMTLQKLQEVEAHGQVSQMSYGIQFTESVHSCAYGSINFLLSRNEKEKRKG